MKFRKPKISKSEIKKQEKKALTMLNAAIDDAVDDTGLLPENYGMLEERVRWYLEMQSYETGILIHVILDRVDFSFLIILVETVKKRSQHEIKGRGCIRELV